MGINYFNRHGFSINEGFGPANVHISWVKPRHWLFFYASVLGRRCWFRWERKRK